MKRRMLIAVLCAYAVVELGNRAVKGQVALDERRGEYVSQIKPLLRERCYSCHGALKQEGGLRLDTAQLMLKGGDSGPAIKRGDSGASLLLERISASDPAERMPPEDSGTALTGEQIGLLKTWIDSGALAPLSEEPEADPRDHWAFQQVARPSVPAIESKWIRNPIDAFLAKEHARVGLVPQPKAPRIIQLRRLYLDLLGVPPSVEEIEAFEQDESPQAYGAVVKRLLDDPRHGERWARHWMDIWR
ncbi:MAG: DUF1549 domain-containing protein, partial [Planctomycetota bacterium]